MKKTFTNLVKEKERELRELKARKSNLMRVISFSDNEDAMKSVLLEVKLLEKETIQVEVELEKAKIKALKEQKNINIKQIIAKLKGDKFRNNSFNIKISIIQAVIKSIHIHPNNVTRIDVWGAKSPERPSCSTKTQSGVVLPFYKQAKIFEFSDEKKPATLKLPVRMG